MQKVTKLYTFVKVIQRKLSAFFRTWCTLVLNIRQCSSDCCRQTGVGWLTSTNVQFFSYAVSS